MRRVLRVVDLFAGAGGLAQGFRSAGYDVRVAVENDDTAIQTLRRNHPSTTVVPEDVRDVDGPRILEASGGTVDLVVGGPPCQGFSIHGPRDPRHPSAALLDEFARVVEQLTPAAFLIENVPGLASFRRGFVLDQLVRRLNRIQIADNRYTVVLDTLDAASHGVPQHRRRIFIVGILGEAFRFPAARSGRITINEAIGDLPAWTSGSDEVLALPASQPLSAYQRERRRGARTLQNHSAKKLQELRRQRIATLEEGDDRRALPEDLQAGGREGKYRRLRGSAPSPTITAHMAHDTSDFIHPRYDRMLTVREAARLQSFDDTYVFTGSQYQQFKQVGNAVPPLLGGELARALELPVRRALASRYARTAARSRRRAASA